MIEKTVAKYRLDDEAATTRDLAFWRSRTAEERLSAVEILRRQVYGNSERFQRVFCVTQREAG